MRAYTALLLFVLITTLSCTRQVEEFESEPLSDYMPLKVGKYITYRTDSTVFTNFGRSVEVHSYQEKHVVDAQIPDALGRSSYRVLRYIRAVNALSTDPWKPDGSYFITPSQKTVEVIENNLRFIRLAMPLKEGFTWKGNQFLPEDPYVKYDLSSSTRIWESKILGLNETATINNKTFNNVITIESENDSGNISSNFSVANASVNGYRSLFTEKYAKGIGLIYQEFIFWLYQTTGGGYYTGFGIKRSIIDHN